MGQLGDAVLKMKIVYFNYLFELNKNIESLIKNKSDSYIEQIVNELTSFFMSDKIAYYGFLYKEDVKDFEHLEIICELNERYLFNKCLFPLLEMFINLKFEEHLTKMKNYIPQNIDKKTLEEINKNIDCKEFQDFPQKIENNPFKTNKIFMVFNDIFHSFLDLLFTKKDSFKINEEEKKTLFYLYFFEFNRKIENLIKNKSDSYIEQIINEISSILMSENFLNFCYFILEGNYQMFFEDLMLICESNERFLFFKCLFPLLEKLIILKFETQLIKMKNYNPQKKKKEYLKEFIKQMKQLFENKGEIVCKKFEEDISNNISNNISITSYSDFFLFTLEILFEKKGSFKDKFCEKLNIILEHHKEKIPIKNLLEYYYKLESLTHTQDLYQIFIFFLNIYLCPQEKIMKFDSPDSGRLIFNTNLNENMILLFETKSNIPPLIVKRNETKISVNFLEIIDIKNDNSINIIKGFNIFTQEEIIIIKIDEEKLKEQKITFEEMKNIINNYNNNKIKKIYIQIKDKFIEFNESNDSYLKKIYKPFLIEEDKNIIENNSQIKLIDETKINKEMNELKEKIKDLENKLKIEKDKNKLLEKQIVDLKNELNKEINKNKDAKENIEVKNINLNELNKESLYKMIFEKDNEIKILKAKLSRFPFELNESEKLISVIFTTSEQKFYHSIICKNTDKFNIIENKFYDAYSDYAETENYFIVNGNKVNRAKTLEFNKIKSNDIIILYQIE